MNKLEDNSDIIGSVMNKKLNGAILPERIYKTPSIIKIKRDLLLDLLKKENEIRLNEKTKKKFDDAEDNFDMYRLIDIEIRKDTLKYFNFDPDVDDSFKAYELACGEYINDNEIRNSVVWMYYDKTRMGNLKINDEVITKDINLYNLEGREFPFKDLLSDNLPNIVISGSMSWPPFRTKGVTILNKWNELYANKLKINLIVIYISEAHAADEWSLSNIVTINQHRTIEDWISAAKLLLQKKCGNYLNRIYVDNIVLPNYENTYSGWPERGYIFHYNKIVHICYGNVEDLVRWPEEINQWLEKNII